MKQQDLLGVLFAIGITVIAVGVVFAGDTSSETSTVTTRITDIEYPLQTDITSHVTRDVMEYNFGGITTVEGESIEFEFVPNNEVNLDESNGFIRAKITYNGFQPQMGLVTLGVFSVNTGEFVKQSDIQFDLIGDDVWKTDVMQRFDKQDFIDNPDLLGTYLLRVDTEYGALSGKSPFTVVMPSIASSVDKKILAATMSTDSLVQKIVNVELSYDEKLEYSLKTEQVLGHLISAMDAINQENYGLAQMHLIHPEAHHSDLADSFSSGSICSQKIPLILQTVASIDPAIDKQIIEKRFSQVFKVLNECRDIAINIETDEDLKFNIDLIDKILEQSLLEYLHSTEVEGMGKLMKYQDSLSLVIRAHMKVSSSDIFNDDGYNKTTGNFKKLFVSYIDKASFNVIEPHTNDIRNDVKKAIGV